MMSTVPAIAEGFKKYKDGGNWTGVHLHKVLEDVTWEMATTTIYGCNTIATLVFHINYYVKGVIEFFNNGKLEIRDKYSFDAPSIQNEVEWQKFLQQTYSEMDHFSELMLAVKEADLSKTFVDEKYGSYYKNLNGILEHGYYHMGQIVILKKVLTAQANAAD